MTPATDGQRWYGEHNFKLDEKKVERFRERVRLLAQKTFGEDGEGACPVATYVIDRTRYRLFHFWPVPHDNGVEEATFNLRVAFEEWNTEERLQQNPVTKKGVR